jgi:hypothetical protein
VNLPNHRRIQSGRTYSHTYNPVDYAAICGPYRHSRWWIDPAIAIIAVAVIAIVSIIN